MSKGRTTGIDWKQLWALQDMSIEYGASNGKRGGASLNDGYVTLTSNTGVSLNEVIKFLDTQGDVSSISNPKVLTLNNQPALITAGTEYFYKITTVQTLAGGNTGTQSENQNIQSVFAGVLLDITPEISNDDTITLKINPSLSEAVDDSFAEDETGNRTMPPDLQRRQLSSVVTVKDGNRIILGGLINTRKSVLVHKVPILGDIPILEYLFKYEERLKVTQELVIIIEPHIIKADEKSVSLKDLGYQEYSDDIVMSGKNSIDQIVDKALIRDKDKVEAK
jgi:general secretion pathway protein D